jgi:hypothetical protein
VAYDEFVKLMLPKLDTGERAHVVRQVLDGTSVSFADYRARAYDVETLYLDAAQWFMGKYRTVKQKTVSASRSANSNARWERQKAVDSRPKS